MNNILFLYLSMVAVANIYSQNPSDKMFQCSRTFSQKHLKNFVSTLTDNQKRIDINYYKINLEVNIQDENINGIVFIKGSVGMDQPDFFELDFSDQMEVDSVKVNENNISFEHNENLLSIPAPDIAIPEGYDFNIEVFYNGTPPVTGFGSFNFDSYNNIPHIWTLSEPYGSRTWWPCKDDPSDKADSVDIIITIDENQIAVSNGLLFEEVNLDNNLKRYYWKERYPIATYLVSITTYPYTVWHDEYISANGDTLPLDYYVYPDHYEIVYNNYLLTKDMMTVFSDRFGEYPFIDEKYGHVEFGRGGGMEHQTITSMGGYSQWLIAHELGHQWWGNLVTCNSFDHIWLNEGFARFSEAIWEEAYNGFDAYKNYWINHSYYGPGTIYVENPSNVGQIFDVNLTYNKAGWVVHMLRGVMGDSLFFETLKSYGSNDSLAYNSATTEDFKNICEDISGLDLHDFFQQWIYGSHYPRYGVSWDVNNEDELIVNIEQQQSWQYFNMPIQLEIIIPFDTLNFVLDNDNQYQQYNLGSVGSPTFELKLDPDNWILKEVEYLSVSNIIPKREDLILYPAYPNPFNPTTSIQYYVPENFGEINSFIKIYDIRGKLVEEFSSNKSYPGLNKLSWNAKNQGSGTYFIQLKARNYFYEQKVQLVK